MNWIDPYTFLLMILAISSSFVAVALLKSPRKLLRNFLAGAAALSSLFIILTIFELHIENRNAMIVLRNFQQISIVFAPILLFGYAKELHREEAKTTLRLTGLLAVPSILDVALAFTDKWHGWMRESITVETVWNYTELSITSTAVNSVFSSYSYAVSLLTVFLLVRNMFDVPKNYRSTLGLSVVAVILPIVSITALSLLEVKVPGMFALSYGSMALLLIIANRNRDFNTVWPVSRQLVLENLSEGILLIDARGCIIEANRAICDMASHIHKKDVCPKDLLHKRAVTVFKEVEGLEKSMEKGGNTEFSVEAGERFYDIAVTKLKEKRQPIWLVVAKDVTEKKVVERELEHLASLDSLTGLKNRNAFLSAYEKAGAGEDRVFVLMDIDYFKNFNDTYGHVAGDEVLRAMSELLGEHFGEEGEVVSRFGGEEFGILLQGEPEEVETRITRFCEHLKRLNKETDSLIKEEITVSAGIHAFTAGEEFDAVYHCADQAMYQAKRNGRDQLSFTGLPSPVKS
ncbi:histidine kinase N-terminal 7TM domain-containing diguanylate cyclase [Salimicrobium humidisoli]|uniref:GGDEF domain-containing protein n=1 Tax=Salimicrobium humidisoli TaxID=2029857 RepID=A0ABX4HV13_9BACI|nr:diguanylate cyclase [Salimicrobium humidisoli]PBB06950.1 hypothetical protein CKW00_00385 [Salimicrobium humidisoli]